MRATNAIPLGCPLPLTVTTVNSVQSLKAITESREPVNPRPTEFAAIAKLHLNSSTRIVGFSTYSEGCNDDVNKAVWSAVGWDGEAASAASIASEWALAYTAGGASLTMDSAALGLVALSYTAGGAVSDRTLHSTGMLLDPWPARLKRACV
jgi:hypothetical protein